MAHNPLPIEVSISELNETFIKVTSEDESTMMDLYQYFSFEVPNSIHSPKRKFGNWDGYIHLFQRGSGKLYKGLFKHVVAFCLDRGLTPKISANLKNFYKQNQGLAWQEIVKSQNLVYTPHNYQMDAFKRCLSDKRVLLESPTGSGKSLIMYMTIRWILENTSHKMLVLVPNVSLVLQLMKDFQDYCPEYDILSNIHEIYEGCKKNHKTKRIYISTWQSLQELPADYFHQFDVAVSDESQGLTAKSAKHIFENCINAEYKLGFTGTVVDTECHKLVMEGLTGPHFKVTTTKELMDNGTLSTLDIKCLVLKYSQDIIKTVPKTDYAKQIEFIVNFQKRTDIITKICKNITGENTLILTQSVDHTVILKEQLEKAGKVVFVVRGEIDKHERERIRQLAEKHDGIVIIATYQTFQAGINIKNLQNIIFGTPSKSQIRILQSIGRGLRTDGKFNKCRLFDIIDNLSTKSSQGMLYKHFFERVKIYTNKNNQFKYEIITIPIT